MNVQFFCPHVYINSASEVWKSEDGENFSFLYGGGEYLDFDLCLPSPEEDFNYYFYSGDGQILNVAVKMV